MIRAFRRRSGEECGAVLAITCIAMVVMFGATALAVDIGRETVRNRRLEQVTEAVAFDAIRAVNGQTVSQLTATNGPVTLAVTDSASRNNFPVARLAVQLGTYSNGTFTPTNNPNDVPTAVQTAATETTNFLFQHGSITGSRGSSSALGGGGCVGGGCGNPGNPGPCTTCVIKVSSGGFSIGSWLASVSSSDSPILNALFGDSFHLNAVSYTGLVNASLSLQQIGLNMPVSVGVLSPTQLLNTSVSVNNFMLASVAALNAQGNTAAATVLDSMILNASLTGNVKLGDFITVASGGEAAAATAGLDVLQLLTASAFVIEKNGGHALTIPTATVSVPNLTSITASATVIEPAKIVFGPVGVSVSTAQVRLTVNPVINLTLGSWVLGVTLNGALPLDLTAAGATGTLSAINCATPGITVASTTQAVNLNTAVSVGLGVTALGINLGLASLNIAAGVKTAPGNYSTSFSYPSEFGPSHAKSVGSSALGLNGLLNITSANISVLGLVGVSAAAIAGLLISPLDAVLTGIDNALVVPVARTLGVKFGGADIAALGYACNTLKLVG